MSEFQITLYNTKTREKAVLNPLDSRCVRMYVCGPTVYDRAHIGNARPIVVFDVLYRLLQHRYGAKYVVYARNFTDVDDKINARAAQSGRKISQITEETIAWFHEDMDSLGALRPDHEPRATAYITQMIAMIEQLISNDAAYETEGHVLFHVPADADYGTLSRRSLDEMQAGARVEIAPYKRDSMDFVLWKPSSSDLPGWDSPWGRGRPGWHIECSAMSRDLLGGSFDIHGGGIDLAFPHHENECAQSRCAYPEDSFAQIWMHNGYLMTDGEKMSKSLGNFLTVADLRQNTPGEVIRLAILSAHYRKPLIWTVALVAEMRKVLEKWRMQVAGVTPADTPSPGVIAALADDLNTPKAIAELHQLANAEDWAGLKASAQLMGLLMDSLGGWECAPEADADLAVFIEQLLAERVAAKQAKDYARADAIRAGLLASGVVVKDTREGANWKLSNDFDAHKLQALRDL